MACPAGLSPPAVRVAQQKPGCFVLAHFPTVVALVVSEEDLQTLTPPRRPCPLTLICMTWIPSPGFIGGKGS